MKKAQPREPEPGARLDLEKMGAAIGELLLAAGVPVEGKELEGTPSRVARMMAESFLDGYQADPARILAGAYPVSSPESGASMVLMKAIPLHGLCPHHLLPYYGRAHVAYLPGKKLASLSSLARLVDCFAHRLEIQETVTRQIAEALSEHLGAAGAAVVLDTDQLCVTMRHPERRGTRTITQHFTGVFERDGERRLELLKSLESPG